MIEGAAVEAAGQALRDAFDWGVTDFDKQARAALEAAAPHIEAPFIEALKLERAKVELLLSAQSRPAALPALATAWAKGHAAGRDYQGDGWNSDAHDPATDNPYGEPA